MDIGSSVAVFLVLSLVLLTLFCILTKYFHHKLKQTLEDTAEIYSMVDEISNSSQPDLDLNDKDNAKKKKYNEEIYVEMADLKRPMKDDTDIYGDGILKRKLNQSYNANNNQDTRRSVATLKSFRPERMNQTNRSNKTNRSNENQPDTLRNQPENEELSFKDDKTRHTFINKLVCYDDHGLSIIQVNVSSIKKMGEGSIKEKKKVSNEMVGPTELQFQEQLEIAGFEKEIYGCYRYTTTVEVENMKLNQDYMVTSLKSSEVKEAIEIEDYVKYKIELIGL